MLFSIYKFVNDFIWVILHPGFWSMNEHYSEAVDEIVEHIIQENIAPSSTSTHIVSFGEFNFWTGNYPYSYGTINNLRPSRKNVKRLQNHIMRIQAKDKLTKNDKGFTMEDLEILVLKLHKENEQLKKQKTSSYNQNPLNKNLEIIFGKNGSNVSKDVLKKQFHYMSKKLHPDMGGNTSDFQELNRAYETISSRI